MKFLDGADVGRVPHVAHSRVPLGVPARDLSRPVGRRVVGHDDLEVLERLGQDRLDRLGQVALAVEYGEPHGDARRPGRLRTLPGRASHRAAGPLSRVREAAGRRSFARSIAER